MKVLVTGGAGFIGSHLVDLLVEKNHDIRILVRKGKVHSAYKKDRDPKILEHVKNLDVEIVHGNLLNTKTLEKACRGIDIVYHLAAIAREYEGLPTQVYYKVNTFGTKNLLDVCLKDKIKRFIYISTKDVCGPSLDGKPLTEKTELHPVIVYGKSKLGGEVLSLYYYKKFGLPVTIVRPPLIHGERYPLLARYFRTVKKGIFPIFGSGETPFEFCYVKNLVHGIYLAGTNTKAIGQIYFVSEESYKIKEVVEATGEVMGVDLKVICLPKLLGYSTGITCEILNKIFPFPPFHIKETGRPYFSRRTVEWTTEALHACDISKIKKELGYRPLFSLKEGLRRTIEWHEKMGLI
jgi:nucleoside-diphosphate-sugar epimerase